MLLCFGNSLLCSSKRVGVEKEKPANSPADTTKLKKTIGHDISSSCSMTEDEAYSFHYQQKDRYHRRRNAILDKRFCRTS